MTLRNLIFLSLISIITIILIAVYHRNQPVLEYNQCPLCDAHQYLKLYEYFKGGSNFDLKFPYYQRVLVPFLASLMATFSPLQSFFILNSLFSIASVIALFFVLKKLKIKDYIIVLVFLWFLLHWSGLLRQYIQDPAVVDVPTFLFQSLFILIIYNRKFRWLWLLGPIATLQKESFIALIFVLLFTLISFNYFFNKDFKWKDVLISFILTLIIEIIVVITLPQVSDERTFLYTLAVTTYLLMEDPLRFMRWGIAFYTAYGGFLVLGILKFKEKAFDSNFLFILIFSILYLFFGLFAGGDMTRILTLGFPFIISLLALLINNQPPFVVILSFLLSVPLLRLVSAIPDFGATISLEESWWIEYSKLEIASAYGFYCLLHLLIIIIFAHFYRLFPTNVLKKKNNIPE